MVGRLYEWQLPLERQALAAAAELAAVEPGERLLDVATGTGGLPRALAARGARPREAVGLDRSISMLAVAAARLPPDWSLRRGDAKHLAFPDQSFDLVSACYLLHLSAQRTGSRCSLRSPGCSAREGAWSRSPPTAADQSPGGCWSGSQGHRACVRWIQPASSTPPGCAHCERDSSRRGGPRCACSASGPRTRRQRCRCSSAGSGAGHVDLAPPFA